MKNLSLYNNLLVIVAVASMFLISCQNGNSNVDNVPNNVLEIEVADSGVNSYEENIVSEQLTTNTNIDSIVVNVDDMECRIDVEVDFPLDGPQPLTDSIKKFIINELYGVFDWGEEDEVPHVPFNEVRLWDGINIVDMFIKRYRPMYENSSDLCRFTNGLSMRMVSQTETFVTFFGEYMVCGAACHYDYCYFIFRKRDGKMIKQLITNENMEKFAKDNPQYTKISNPLWHEIIWEGLLENGFDFSYFDNDVGWGDVLIPYDEILPYLNEEVQELVLK